MKKQRQSEAKRNQWETQSTQKTIWDFYLFAKPNPMVDKNHRWKMFLKDSDEQMGQQIK